MKITKLGHCCMLIEEKGARILTDPGTFTANKHIALTGLDAIVYTHEHYDHYHLESLKILKKSSPNAVVICNMSVGKLLEAAGIDHEIIGHEENTDIKGVAIEGFGATHAPLHSSLPLMLNTGFFLGTRLWYPGDAFTNPKRPVDILALPIAGPWMKLSETLDYAIELKPKVCFPVHDGILNPAFVAFGSLLKVPGTVLDPKGIQFLPIELDREYDF